MSKEPETPAGPKLSEAVARKLKELEQLKEVTIDFCIFLSSCRLLFSASIAPRTVGVSDSRSLFILLVEKFDDGPRGPVCHVLFVSESGNHFCFLSM